MKLTKQQLKKLIKEAFEETNQLAHHAESVEWETGHATYWYAGQGVRAGQEAMVKFSADESYSPIEVPVDVILQLADQIRQEAQRQGDSKIPQ